MPDPYRSGIFLVPLTGLEPVRILLRGILSPLCLPIPPQRHFPYKSTVIWYNIFHKKSSPIPDSFYLLSVHKKRIRFPFFSKRFLESVFQPLQNCSSAFPKKCGMKAGWKLWIPDSFYRYPFFWNRKRSDNRIFCFPFPGFMPSTEKRCAGFHPANALSNKEWVKQL